MRSITRCSPIERPMISGSGPDRISSTVSSAACSTPTEPASARAGRMTKRTPLASSESPWPLSRSPLLNGSGASSDVRLRRSPFGRRRECEHHEDRDGHREEAEPGRPGEDEEALDENEPGPDVADRAPERVAVEQRVAAPDGEYGDDQVPQPPAPELVAEKARGEVVDLVAVRKIGDRAEDAHDADRDQHHRGEREPAGTPERVEALVETLSGHRAVPPAWSSRECGGNSLTDAADGLNHPEWMNGGS